MPQIDVDFDVWKALTGKRVSEKHTYNDVLRSLLELESVQESILDPVSPLAGLLDATPVVSQLAIYSHSKKDGFYSRDLFLPNETELRSIYKGRRHTAQILNCQWVDERGQIHSSPSAAAKAITGNNVNGLRFWEALLPTGGSWCRLDLLS